jgi:hypothetical protein
MLLVYVARLAESISSSSQSLESLSDVVYPNHTGVHFPTSNSVVAFPANVPDPTVRLRRWPKAGCTVSEFWTVAICFI